MHEKLNLCGTKIKLYLEVQSAVLRQNLLLTRLGLDSAAASSVLTSPGSAVSSLSGSPFNCTSGMGELVERGASELKGVDVLPLDIRGIGAHALILACTCENKTQRREFTCV